MSSHPTPAGAGVTAGSPAPRPHRSRAARILLRLLGGLAALVVVLYAVALLLGGNTLPREAAVSGVPVGGLTTTEAQDRLEAELGPRADAPIRVSAGDVSTTVDPAAAGLRVDYEASIAAVGGGRGLDPRRVLATLTGGSAVEAVVAVDRTAQAEAVRQLAGEVDTPPVDATLAYRDGELAGTDSRDGRRLEQEDAAAALTDGYLSEEPVRLPVAVAEPAVTTAEADQVRQGYAEPALSGPVRIRAGDAGSFSVTPAMIGPALRFRVEDGALVPGLDAEDLRRAADDAVSSVELDEPRDATVRLRKGRPVVVPAVDGTTVTAAALAAAVEPALTKTGGERSGEVTLSGAKAKVSTEDAEKLGITEVTGKYTTYFPYAEYRNVNIGRAAELINGTVLRPGETFSLNKVVGERTAENGFTEGFVISGGKFRRELGGGVSQSATTTFNAMFFAGLKDVEHKPHTLYIDRYPAGREATVAWPNLDLKFTNDTKYGVLIQASTTDAAPGRRGSITVRMWSTKVYDKIESTTPARSNFTTGRDLVDTSAECEPQSPVQGFDVDYARLFYRDGKVVKREKFSWRYGPTDRVRCG